MYGLIKYACLIDNNKDIRDVIWSYYMLLVRQVLESKKIKSILDCYDESCTTVKTVLYSSLTSGADYKYERCNIKSIREITLTYNRALNSYLCESCFRRRFGNLYNIDLSR